MIQLLKMQSSKNVCLVVRGIIRLTRRCGKEAVKKVLLIPLCRMKDCGEDMLVDMSEILFNELAFFRLMQDLDG